MPLAAPPREKKVSIKPKGFNTPGLKLAAFSSRFITDWLNADPSKGRELGLHEYDGRVADYDKTAILKRIDALTKARAELAAIDKAALSPNEALDQAVLLQQIDLYLFRAVDMAEWQKNPRFYEDLFGVNAYLDRDYAPIADRAKQLVTHEKAALLQVKHITANLSGPLSKAVTETAIKVYKGYVDYLQNDVVKQLKDVGDAAFQSEFKQTNSSLAAEAQKIVDHLTKVELPRADNSHVLGPDKYKKLLFVQEGLSTSLADFKAMGEKNLLENKKAYQALQKKAKISRPQASELLAGATKLMDASREFLVKKDLVTIPTEDKAVLKETPPFMRWNSAFLNPPGPYEKVATTAFYYITLPDPSWPKKEQEEYIMPWGTLLSTTVHEVYPGHFLQGQWERKAPTRVQMTFGAYSFIEGWAHYTEQMMLEEGFGADDPQNKLGQLSDALLRNCRFAASLGIHTEGLSLDQVAKRFQKDCFQDKATAREQAVRGTFDPGYFAYTLGKIQILELREEAKKKLGDKFSLKRFHDALLSHGSPAIPLIRDRVLAELGAQ
ncbi:MAG: DUF885 domain-containing protein [Polyangiaceae bacterium]|nr:DUF885 domain-containing protein [Polyangiaceae bacterium]